MIKALKYDPYLQSTELIKWLENKAMDGWFIRKLNSDSLYVHFDKGSPKRVHYAIFYERSKHFNVEEFIRTLKEQGWKNIGSDRKNKNIYLFINEDENPIPIETDAIELSHKHERIRKSLTANLLTWLFVIAFNVLMTLGRGASVWDQLFLISMYGYVSFDELINVIRFSFVDHHDSAKRKKLANTARYARNALIMLISIVLLRAGLNYFHMNQRSVSANPILNISDYYSNVEFINERYTQSVFSVSPNATAFTAIVREGEPTQSIYQTKRQYLYLSDKAFNKYKKSVLSNSNIDGLEYQTIMDTDFELVLSDGVENLSVIRTGRTVFTLHTIHIALTEHQSMLEDMKELVP